MIWAYTEWEREGRLKAEGEVSKGMAKMFILGASFCSKSFFSGLEKIMPEGQNHQTSCLPRIVLWKEYQILLIRP